jgi:hypothetical protein
MGAERRVLCVERTHRRRCERRRFGLLVGIIQETAAMLLLYERSDLRRSMAAVKGVGHVRSIWVLRVFSASTVIFV